MEDFLLEILASIFGILIAGCVTYFFALKQYRRGLVVDGLAVANAYMSTIEATQDSLRNLKTDDDYQSVHLTKLPPDAVYDFRREDWFSVHHALCGDLGKLVHLDPELGEEAVSAVSLFFQKFKFARELFAYSLAIQKAAAIAFAQGDEASYDSISRHAGARHAELGTFIVELDKDAQVAMDLLEKLKTLAKRAL